MATVLRVPDLLDLALSGNEVNNKYLLVTLQAMSHHLNLNDVKIEFRGSDSEQIQAYINESTDEKIKNIPVSLVSGSQMSSLKDQSFQRKPSSQQETEELAQASSNLEKGPTDSVDKKLNEPSEDIVVVESGRVFEPIKKRHISSTSFARLENKVKSLQAQMEAISSQVLPTDEAILETARSQQESKPITDMWQGLNITKRMSGAEEGIDKLASLLETVAREYADLRTVIDQMQQEFGDDIGETLHNVKLAANYAKKIKPREKLFGTLFKKFKQTKSGTPPTGKESSTRVERDTTTDAAEKEESKVTPIQEGSGTDVKGSSKPSRDVIGKVGGEQIPSGDIKIPQSEGPSKELQAEDLTTVIQLIPETQEVTRTKVNNILLQHEYMKNTLEQMIAQVNTLADVIDVVLPDLVSEIPHMEGIRKKLAELRNVADHGQGSNASLSLEDTRGKSGSVNSNDKLKELEVRQSKYAAKVKRQEYMLCEKTLEYDLRLSDMIKSIHEMSGRIDELKLKQHPAENETKEILEKMKGLEEAIVEIGCSAQELQDDAEQKNVLFETLASELELLKSAKADRFELETGLSEKADCEALKKKVSLDIFEVACTDLSKGIDEALNRISLQENLLSTTAIELQNSIETKLDRVDLEPIKAEIDQRIDTLATEVERIANVKDGRVAAGAKQKYITNVNCISCDRNVSIRTEPDVPSIPALADFPTRKTIRPYITYELDYLRRMRNKDPEVEKYITYEELARRYQIKNLESFENLENVPHLSTRYCGGSHTVLGPQQKVVHTGHFPTREDPYHRQ